jgi:hypothetical protein
MEETLSSFAEKFLANNKEDEYYFVYDDTGTVLSLTTDTSEKNKIKISTDTAKLILSGCEMLSSYVIDTIQQKASKKKTVDISRIDDVVHRIIGKEWYQNQELDIELFYHTATSELEFTLHSKHYDTIWSGNTQMLFTITDYNDPNTIRKMITVTIEDLIENSVKVRIENTEKKFSVYTRRIFDRYAITEV